MARPPIHPGEILAEDPIAAVEPRVVEEAHRREEMAALAFLRAALFGGVGADGADFDAHAVGVPLRCPRAVGPVGPEVVEDPTDDVELDVEVLGVLHKRW